MLTFPSVRLPNDDWVRLMSLAFDAENDLHPVGTFLRTEVHRAIVMEELEDGSRMDVGQIRGVHNDSMFILESPSRHPHAATPR